jgi:hypothetical protein
MPRTLTDEQLRFYEAKRATADLAESIFGDPQLADEAKALIKRKHPNLPIPDFDLRSEMNRRFDADRQEREDAERAKREETDKKEFQRLRKETQDKYGFTDEAMAKLEKFMEDRYVGDYEVAASYFAAQQPKSIDSANDPHFWQHNKQKGFQEIINDPEAWGRNELFGAVTRDMQRYRDGR